MVKNINIMNYKVYLIMITILIASCIDDSEHVYKTLLEVGMRLCRMCVCGIDEAQETIKLLQDMKQAAYSVGLQG